MSNQLINYYADDPECDGFGLSELADIAGSELAAKDAQIKKLKDALAAMVEAYGPVHDDELSPAEIEARDHGEYVLWELGKQQLEGER